MTAPARVDVRLRRERAASRRELLVGAVVIVLLAACVWQLPDTVRRLRLEVGTARHLTDAERQATPARYLGVPEHILPQAAELIPEGATFEVITGPNVEADAPFALAGIRALAASTLLPRRLTGDPATADWVLAYGGDLEALPVTFSRRVTLAPGVVLAEAKR